MILKAIFNMTATADLQRFLNAQQEDYATALQEIKAGRKSSHWMWYIFPQINGLGFSSTSVYYGIKDIEEASAYLKHPMLGKNLLEISEALLSLEGRDATSIFGYPDDLKLKSSMTLFSSIPDSPAVFQQVLDKYFDGDADPKTLQLLSISQ
ncbi:hypothetical protein GCM10011387_19710 [Pedobacter quisquiliarum]|uniref:Calpastatin n=2 Tax=Pedobacter quisquiliarum TaxID=1834438 RepID=A0A916XEL7_9SPHI|nr:hypothetical protein GCM10011387_19710 [Pedobacter quisquiliarum]